MALDYLFQLLFTSSIRILFSWPGLSPGTSPLYQPPKPVLIWNTYCWEKNWLLLVFTPEMKLWTALKSYQTFFSRLYPFGHCFVNFALLKFPNKYLFDCSQAFLLALLISFTKSTVGKRSAEQAFSFICISRVHKMSVPSHDKCSLYSVDCINRIHTYFSLFSSFLFIAIGTFASKITDFLLIIECSFFA